MTSTTGRSTTTSSRPAAFLTGGDSPLAVVSVIALAGIAAVAVTWWLARSIAGPVAGLVAGLLLAVSTSAVDGSTFIWNPNLIALSSAVALAGAWQAWRTQRPWWWLVAALGTAVTVQCHVLGVAMVPIVGALLVADWRRSSGAARAAVARAGLGWVVIVALSYLPLAIHELTNDFSELEAALAYLRGGGDPSSAGPLARFPIVSLRVITWPLAGLITEAVVPALLAAVAVVAVVILRWRAHDPTNVSPSGGWASGSSGRALFLTIAAPSLAVRDPGPAERPLPRVRGSDGRRHPRARRGRGLARGGRRKPGSRDHRPGRWRPRASSPCVAGTWPPSRPP